MERRQSREIDATATATASTITAGTGTAAPTKTAKTQKTNQDSPMHNMKKVPAEFFNFRAKRETFAFFRRGAPWLAFFIGVPILGSRPFLNFFFDTSRPFPNKILLRSSIHDKRDNL